MFMIHAYYVRDTPSKDLFFNSYQNYALPLIYKPKYLPHQHLHWFFRLPSQTKCFVASLNHVSVFDKYNYD